MFVEEFKKVQKNILDMLEDLDEGLSDITEQNKTTEKTAATDQSSKPDENDSNQEEVISKQIDNIQQLMSNIDNSTYGICLSCGQAIKKEDIDSSGHQCPHCGADNHGK